MPKACRRQTKRSSRFGRLYSLSSFFKSTTTATMIHNNNSTIPPSGLTTQGHYTRFAALLSTPPSHLMDHVPPWFPSLLISHSTTVLSVPEYKKSPVGSNATPDIPQVPPSTPFRGLRRTSGLVVAFGTCGTGTTTCVVNVRASMICMLDSSYKAQSARRQPWNEDWIYFSKHQQIPTTSFWTEFDNSSCLFSWSAATGPWYSCHWVSQNHLASGSAFPSFPISRSRRVRWSRRCRITPTMSGGDVVHKWRRWMNGRWGCLKYCKWPRRTMVPYSHLAIWEDIQIILHLLRRSLPWLATANLRPSLLQALENPASVAASWLWDELMTL